jgi:hypothetical protein
MTQRVMAKLPEEFILVLAKQAKVHRWCRVVWRSEDEIGVRFVIRARGRSRSVPANSAASAAR